MRASALPALLFAAGLLGSAGCFGITPMRMTTDGVLYTPVDPASVAGRVRCGLRVCMMEPVGTDRVGRGNDARANWLAPSFPSLVRETEIGPAACDIGVHYPELTDDYGEVYSAYTKRFLARFEVSALQLGNAICRAFDEKGPLFAKIPGDAVLAARARREANESNPPPDAAPAPPGVASAATPVATPAARPVPPAPAPRPDCDTPDYSTAERPDDFAIVVGVEDYSDLPKARYAANDAAAVRAHLRALGVPERNLVFLTDSKAVRSSIQKYVEDWLPRLTKPDSRVYFYFSGHGSPDAKTGDAYLMPWDGDPNFLKSTAYPVRRLYEKLAALPAQQVLVAMDSCFSGAGGRSVLASGARPLLNRIETGAVTGRVTALTASAATEISGSLDDKGHGAFTYFLLEGLNGAAKDAQGRVTAKSLHDYLTPRVEDEARRLNRDQTPQLLGADPGLVLR